ncbi:MAG TPA: hypothetical protein VKX41_16875 [Alloacidobacterium sp.]|nr:hypothetical protein [Alloacidobacterium sp.]
MLRKTILVVALFALTVTQALAVNCDLRCALMDESPGNDSCNPHASMAMGHEQMEHCHGMSMQAGSESTAELIGHDGCGAAICNVGLVALMKSPATGDSLASTSSATHPVLVTLPAPAGGSLRSMALRRSSRQAGNTPLELRPGSSLRI